MAKFYYGGQAVVEGVMMRGRTSVAMAVRKPDNDVFLYEEGLPPRLYQNPLARLPFFRGILLLGEMLFLGTRLMGIATDAALDEENRTPASSDPHQPLAPSTPSQSDSQSKSGGLKLGLTVLVSLVFAIGLFFLAPLFLANLVQWGFSALWHVEIGGWVNAIEGVIRLLFLIGYMSLIGLIPDIQRVFGYHGAEHKAINALEHGEPLDVPHVRNASRLHTRCGTGFLLIVVVLSILAFALIPGDVFLLKALWRILLVPVVAAIGYELMRLGAGNYRFRVVRWLMAPSLALQGLTTREPDDSMIECAIAALERVLLRDEVPGHTGIQSPLGISAQPESDAVQAS